MAVVMNILSNRETLADQDVKRNPYWLSFMRYWPGFCLIIFLIGLFPASNFWDYPIYIVVSGVMYFYANLRLYEYKLKAWLVTICQVILTGVVAYAVVFPFHMNFEAISSEIEFVTINSKFYQLLVLYGYQVLFFAMLIAAAVIAYYKFEALTNKKNRGSKRAETVSNATLYARLSLSEAERPKFYDFIEKSNPADVMVMILFTCAIGLIAIPEIIYVKDIYGDLRANTMFKLCYQAFIMLALGVGYTFSRMFLGHGRKSVYSAGALVLSSILLIGAFMYPFHAIPGWYGNLHFSNYKGLDGTQYMLTYEEQLTWLVDERFPEGEEPEGDEGTWPRVLSIADDLPIIQYINKNIKGQPVIAEANWSSYTRYGRVAANTGLPDIYNWWTHQTLWRNKHSEESNQRIWDLEALYTTDDPNTARGVIEKYNVSYIIVGKLERARYRQGVNEDLIRGLGEIICQSNDSYLVKVNR
jgi:YYY domain-containing protein